MQDPRLGGLLATETRKHCAHEGLSEATLERGLLFGGYLVVLRPHERDELRFRRVLLGQRWQRGRR